MSIILILGLFFLFSMLGLIFGLLASKILGKIENKRIIKNYSKDNEIKISGKFPDEVERNIVQKEEEINNQENKTNEKDNLVEESLGGVHTDGFEDLDKNPDVLIDEGEIEENEKE